MTALGEAPGPSQGNANDFNGERGQTGGEPPGYFKTQANEESVEETWNPFGSGPVVDPSMLDDGSPRWRELTAESYNAQANEESVEEPWKPFG